MRSAAQRACQDQVDKLALSDEACQPVGSVLNGRHTFQSHGGCESQAEYRRRCSAQVHCDDPSPHGFRASQLQLAIRGSGQGGGDARQPQFEPRLRVAADRRPTPRGPGEC